MLGPLGEDFAKVKASITTALDKITQVLKMAVKIYILNTPVLDPKHKSTKLLTSPGSLLSHMSGCGHVPKGEPCQPKA